MLTGGNNILYLTQGRVLYDAPIDKQDTFKKGVICEY